MSAILKRISLPIAVTLAIAAFYGVYLYAHPTPLSTWRSRFRPNSSFFTGPSVRDVIVHQGLEVETQMDEEYVAHPFDGWQNSGD